jgi:histidine triad (HIT) family protein
MAESNAPSIFARIAAGEIPCHKVFESDLLLAFLDINPLAEGHTLLISKRAVARFEDLTPEEAAELGRRLPELAQRVTAAVGAAGYNLLLNAGQVAGQDVPHVHFHIIPRRSGDGLGYRWKPQTRSAEELAALARRIAETK